MSSVSAWSKCSTTGTVARAAMLTSAAASSSKSVYWKWTSATAITMGERSCSAASTTASAVSRLNTLKEGRAKRRWRASSISGSSWTCGMRSPWAEGGASSHGATRRAHHTAARVIWTGARAAASAREVAGDEADQAGRVQQRQRDDQRRRGKRRQAMYGPRREQRERQRGDPQHRCQHWGQD